MADTSQGDGWWQASDLKWYPPNLHADAEHRARFDPGSEPPDPPPEAPVAPPEVDAADAPGAARASFGELDSSAEALFDPAAPVEIPITRPKGPRSHHRLATILAIVGGLIAVGALVAALVLAFSSGDDESTATATPSPDADPAPTEAAGDEPVADPADDDTPDEPANDEPTPEPPPETPVGTVDAPIAFGQIYEWPEWRGTIVGVVDAVDAGLISEFDDPPEPGTRYLAVIYEATYFGESLSAFEPFIVASPMGAIIDDFACLLDSDALAAIGVDEATFELVPGQTARLAICVEVAEENVDGLLISLDNFSEFGDPLVYGPNGATLPEVGPLPVEAGERTLPTEPLGTPLTGTTWVGAVTEVLDAGAEGLLSAVAEPPLDDHAYVAVVYEVTNNGAQDADFIPMRVSGLGTAVFEPFNGCFLDADAVRARGAESDRFELGAGESAVLAGCLEIPVAELDTFVVRLENTNDVGVILYAAAG